MHGIKKRRVFAARKDGEGDGGGGEKGGYGRRGGGRGGGGRDWGSVRAMQLLGSEQIFCRTENLTAVASPPFPRI